MISQKLYAHFMSGASTAITERVGVEVETIFVTDAGEPLDDAQTSAFFERAVSRHGWSVDSSYQANGRDVIESIRDASGNIIGKEIGTCNIEVATVPLPEREAIPYTRALLRDLYGMLGHRRYRGAILDTSRSILPVAPSSRE